MKLISTFRATIGLTLLVYVNAYAATTYGINECKDWTIEQVAYSRTHNATIQQVVQRTWILAFMSGLNEGISDQTDTKKDWLKSTNASVIFDWTDKYCASNPESNLKAAGIALFNKLNDVQRK